MAIRITSPEFGDGDLIPARFTCQGDGVSPPLEFAGVPAAAVELALLVEDPDAPAGPFTHWVLWHLAPDRAGLAAGESPGGAGVGGNDFGRLGYGPPCPPAGRQHRYVFTIFALSQPLVLPAGASAAQLRAAIDGKVLDSASTIGRYGR